MRRMTSRALAAGLGSALVLGGASGLPAPAQAQDYDMDCKVILCMGAGFPSPDCTDAYDYMLDRIRRFNPLPPFGFCAMSDGSEYTDFTLDYAFLNGNSPASYSCPETHDLYWEMEAYGDGTGTRVFCYTEMIVETYLDFDGDYREEVTFEGVLPAERFDFRVELVLEPGSTGEFIAPVLYTNFDTGHVRQE